MKDHGCDVLQIGGAENHIHVLIKMTKKLSIGKIIEEIKTSSSKWIKAKNQKYKNFYWQHGYGAFSLSPGHQAIVCDYISRQKQHHKITTFEDEFSTLLQKYNIIFDEKYFLG